MNMAITFEKGIAMNINLASPGAKGESIESVSLNQVTGMLTVTLTNGTSFDVGEVGTIELANAAVATIKADITASRDAAATSESNAAGSALDALVSKNAAAASEVSAANSAAFAALSSGSPKGVYATLAALQTAYPTGTTGIYLVTADGKWYYWNSTAWTAGGTYQSTGIADGGVTPAKLDKNTQYVLSDNLVGTVTTNYYLDVSGNILSFTGMAYSDYIPVVAGETIKYFGWKSTGPSGCIYNASKVRIKNLDNPTVSGSFQEMVMPANAAYIRVNFYTVTYPNDSKVYRYVETKYGVQWLQVLAENIPPNTISSDKLSDTIKLGPAKLDMSEQLYLSDNLATTLIEDKYVTADGVEHSYGSGDNGVTDFIPVVAGDAYRYYCYTATNSNGCLYDANKVFIQTITAPATAPDYAEMVMPENAAYLRLNYSGAYLDKIHVFRYLKQPYEISWLKINADNVPSDLFPSVIPDNSIGLSKLTESAVLQLSSTEILDGSVTLASLSQSVIDYMANPVTPINPFDGKKSTWIGDSITAGVGATDAAHRYSNLVVSALSMSAVGYQNLGVSGTTITKDAGATNSFVERICDGGQITVNQDYIFIMGGLNDFATNRTLASQSTALSYFSSNTAWNEYEFFGALNRLITYIRTNHGTANLVYIVPYHYVNENTANGQGFKLVDYVKAIREVCEYYAIPMIDLYKDLPLDPKNTMHFNTYTSFSNGVPDGCHPSDAGNALIAKKVINYLKYQYVI